MVAAGPYVLVTGEKIAESWAGLINDEPAYQLDLEINLDQHQAGRHVELRGPSLPELVDQPGHSKPRRSGQPERDQSLLD